MSSLAAWNGYFKGGEGKVLPAYKSAAQNKLTRDWMPSAISGDSAIAEATDLSTARARDLARNDPILKKSLSMTSALVIGNGIKTYSEAEDANRQYMDDFCESADDDFEHWALHEADITGRMTLYEMQELSFREMVTAGLSLWLKVIVNDPSRTSPLAYQLIELEQIDRQKNRPAERGQTRIVNGIELDRNNRAIAVWLHDSHPYDVTNNIHSLESRRIPTRRLIVNYRPDRISSHIGFTWLNCIAQVSRDTDKFVANELTTRAVKALMTLFVKRNNPGTCLAEGLNAEDAETGRSPVEMGYPAIVEIGQHDDIKIAESNGKSGADAGAFIDLLLGQFAMGAGLSRHRITGNAGEANLASIRAGHIDDERVTSPIQDHQINKVARPVRLAFQSMAASMGNYTGVGVSPDFYAKNRRRMSKLFIISAGDPDFQPKDDGEAAIDRMRSGRSTPQYEIARTGFYWRRNLRQIRQYQDELKRLGLGNPDWTKGAGGTYLPFVPMSEQPVSQPPKSAAPSKQNGEGQKA